MDVANRFKQCERTRTVKWYQRKGIGYLLSHFKRG